MSDLLSKDQIKAIRDRVSQGGFVTPRAVLDLLNHIARLRPRHDGNKSFREMLVDAKAEIASLRGVIEKIRAECREAAKEAK